MMSSGLTGEWAFSTALCAPVVLLCMHKCILSETKNGDMSADLPCLSACCVAPVLSLCFTGTCICFTDRSTAQMQDGTDEYIANNQVNMLQLTRHTS